MDKFRAHVVRNGTIPRQARGIKIERGHHPAYQVSVCTRSPPFGNSPVVKLLSENSTRFEGCAVKRPLSSAMKMNSFDCSGWCVNASASGTAVSRYRPENHAGVFGDLSPAVNAVQIWINQSREPLAIAVPLLRLPRRPLAHSVRTMPQLVERNVPVHGATLKQAMAAPHAAKDGL